MRPDPNLLAPLCLALALLVAPGGARADVVHLEGGGRVEGRVVEDGDQVRVEVSGGTLVFARGRVARIERQAPPEERLRAAAAELASGDHDGVLALVRRADAAGLGGVADDILAAAAESAPDDVVLASALRRRRVLRDALPDAPGSAERLVRDFGAGGRILRTNHFLVVHDIDERQARRRGDLLEAAWGKFHELSHALELTPRRLTTRLEVLLFADHARWLAAAAIPEERLRGMSGLFVPRTGRVLLYDPSQSPEARTAARQLAAETDALADAMRELEGHERELDVLRSRLEELEARSQRQVEQRDRLRDYISESQAALDAHRRKLDDRRDELRGHERQLDGWEDRESLASTTHEACHQMAFATGIGRPGEPRWLTEGLATLFELESRESFVLEAPNEGRLRDVRRHWAEGRGGDLRKILAGTHFDDPSAAATLVYAEAWSLAHYLARRHATAFARYVQEAELLPHLPTVAERRVAEFTRYFGTDLDALERDWRRTIERL